MLGCSEHFEFCWSLNRHRSQERIFNRTLGQIDRGPDYAKEKGNSDFHPGAEFEKELAVSTSTASIRQGSVFTVQRLAHVSFSWVPHKCNCSIDFKVAKWKGNYCGVRQWRSGLWDIVNHVSTEIMLETLLSEQLQFLVAWISHDCIT